MIAATVRLAAAIAFTMGTAAAAATLDPRLPAYDPQPATPPKDARKQSYVPLTAEQTVIELAKIR